MPAILKKSQILKACGISPVRISRITNVEKISNQKLQNSLDKIIQKVKNI